MVNQILYNYPVMEAIIDIFVTLPKGTTLKKLYDFHEEIKAEFPKIKTRKKWTGNICISNEQAEIQSTQGEIEGYWFTTDTESKIIQFRLDGYSFNKLKPYKSWDSFKNEAMIYWDKYKKIAVPTTVSRIGIRYINRIDIPLPITDISEYFQTRPEISEKLPQGLSGFLMRLVIPLPDIIKDDPISPIAYVTQTIGKISEDKKTIPFIFDINIQGNVNLKPEDSDVWSIIECLKKSARDIFQESITDKTRELFL